MGLFSNDIIDDFYKENAKQLNLLEKKEIKPVTKSINYKMRDLIKAKLMR